MIKAQDTNEPLPSLPVTASNFLKSDSVTGVFGVLKQKIVQKFTTEKKIKWSPVSLSLSNIYLNFTKAKIRHHEVNEMCQPKALKENDLQCFQKEAFFSKLYL